MIRKQVSCLMYVCLLRCVAQYLHSVWQSAISSVLKTIHEFNPDGYKLCVYSEKKEGGIFCISVLMAVVVKVIVCFQMIESSLKLDKHVFTYVWREGLKFLFEHLNTNI